MREGGHGEMPSLRCPTLDNTVDLELFGLQSMPIDTTAIEAQSPSPMSKQPYGKCEMASTYYYVANRDQ